MLPNFLAFCALALLVGASTLQDLNQISRKRQSQKGNLDIASVERQRDSVRDVKDVLHKVLQSIDLDSHDNIHDDESSSALRIHESTPVHDEIYASSHIGLSLKSKLRRARRRALLRDRQRKAAAPWFDSSIPRNERVSLLVGAMSLQEQISWLNDACPAIPRLGLPSFSWNGEGLHGVAWNGVATIFPQPIGWGASFDADLVTDIGNAIAVEARAKWVHGLGADGSSLPFAGLSFFTPNVR